MVSERYQYIGTIMITTAIPDTTEVTWHDTLQRIVVNSTLFYTVYKKRRKKRKTVKKCCLRGFVEH